MSTTSNTEQVLRNLHVLLSKSEPYAGDAGKVIVDKQEMLNLLSELNACIYQIMDDYELTKQSRDKAEREFQKQADQIIWDASRKAEDIYAASVLYMDDALSGIQDILKEGRESVSKIYSDLAEHLKGEEQRIKTNQSELKSQLQDLVDTEKYLSLIEERNKEREKQKREGKPAPKKEPSIYANRQSEIKINQEYLDKLGLSVSEEEKEEPEEKDKKTIEEEVLAAEIKVDLDADYFKWKKGKEKNSK